MGTKHANDKERNTVLHKVFKSMIQAVKGKRTISVKDRLTRPKRRLDLGNDKPSKTEYYNPSFGSSSDRSSQPRMVKPPMERDREWHRLKHPKFPQ